MDSLFQNKTQIFLIVTCVLISSCQRSVFVDTITNSSSSKEYYVNLSDLPFFWKDAYLFDGYYTDSEIEETIGARLKKSSDLAFFVVVFTNKGKVVHEECWYYLQNKKPLLSISSQEGQREYLHIIREKPIVKVVRSKLSYKDDDLFLIRHTK